MPTRNEATANAKRGRRGPTTVERRSSRTTAAAMALALMLLGACSSRTLYDSAQGWQRNECQKMPDATQREKCLASQSGSYEDYKRQSEAAKKSP